MFAGNSVIRGLYIQVCQPHVAEGQYENRVPILHHIHHLILQFVLCYAIQM